ncbi:MAG: MtaA/CmuA family methyltransferase [Saccharolobus sp.]|uniref:MtaA/CmuA family methyltransferase n=1 Tax=Saccharolobus sp. TaxID=2100761 RepID=UPI00315F7DB5
MKEVWEGFYRKSSIKVPIICVNQTGTVETMKRIRVFWPEAHVKPEKMAELAIAGHIFLGFESIRIPFDHLVEVEALGVKINLGTMREFPEVIRPLDVMLTQYEFPENFIERGRLPVVFEALKELKKRVKSNVPLIVGVMSPFSILTQAFGLERFLRWIVKDATNIFSKMSEMTTYLIEYGKLLKRYGADIICLEEIFASMLSFNFFKRYLVPILRKFITDVNMPVVLHICGDTKHLLPAIAEIEPAGLSLDEKTDLNEAKKVLRNIKVIGNISTHLLLQGDENAIKQAVRKAIMNHVDIIAPGCSLHPLTPTKNVIAMKKAVSELEYQVNLRETESP